MPRKLLKAKGDGSWEKPSKGEGKAIKFSIEEIACILALLTKKTKSWSTYHSYKDIKTQISFKWNEGNEEKLWINIGPYSKVLDYSQTRILELLLTHLLEEKIKFATTGLSKSVRNKEESSSIVNEGDNLKVVEERIGDNNKSRRIEGEIRADTDKGVLIKLASGEEHWFPKTAVHAIDGETNMFNIDLWILKKMK